MRFSVDSKDALLCKLEKLLYLILRQWMWSIRTTYMMPQTFLSFPFPPLFLSPLLSHLFKKHPLFEACDGKRERLKQSASKLACQKALNQYPSSLQHNPAVLSPPSPSIWPLPFPHSSGCFPSSPSIFSCTPAHSPSCSPALLLFFLSLTLNLSPLAWQM